MKNHNVIRAYTHADHEAVMEIWLMSNLQVHSFISAKYFKNNFSEVSRVIELASVYVWEEEGHILGFIGAMETMVMGLFVKEEARGRGIGKTLLEQLKKEQEELSLSAYVKNPRAVHFYMREKFRVQSERVDEATGEKEILLLWNAEK